MVNETRLPDAAPAVAAPVEGAAEAPAEAWEILARYRSSEALDHAILQLESGGFDREDLGLPEIDPPEERNTPEAGSKAADTDVDEQQSRMVHSSLGGAVGAMVGALAVAATGGVAAAVAGAAIGAGAATAGVANLLSHARSHSEQQTRERLAAEGRLVLAIRTPTPEKRQHACDVVRQTGGELL